MGLISCPDCRKNISDSSATCIHCGRPLAKPQQGYGCCSFVLIGFLGMIILSSIMTVFDLKAPSPVTSSRVNPANEARFQDFCNGLNSHGLKVVEKVRFVDGTPFVTVGRDIMVSPYPDRLKFAKLLIDGWQSMSGSPNLLIYDPVGRKVGGNDWGNTPWFEKD